MTLLGCKRSPLFCASSQVRIDLFFFLPSGLSSTPLQVQTFPGRQSYSDEYWAESELLQAGLLLVKTDENHKNYVSVLTVLYILFCCGSRQGKFSPTGESLLWMNPHLPVAEWGSQRAGRRQEGCLWLHSKQQQGWVRAMHEKENFPEELHFQLSNWMQKSFKSAVQLSSHQALAVSFQGFLEHRHLFSAT